MGSLFCSGGALIKQQHRRAAAMRKTLSINYLAAQLACESFRPLSHPRGLIYIIPRLVCLKPGL
jgi:hypothetical protein